MLSHRRTAILALLLVATGSLVFTTGAAVVNGPTDTFAEDRLAVQPAEGPNGDYAYLNDDDEIVVDVSPTNPNLDPDFRGVNPETLASAEGVFTITYTADEYARVWIEHEGEAVTFVSGGDSVEGEANNVTLAPNETVAVGLRIDTRGEVAGTQLGADDFSIRAEVAEPEDVSDSSPSSLGGGGGGGGLSTTVRSPAVDERRFVASGARSGESVEFDADRMALDGGNVTMDRLELTGVPGGSLELNAAGSPDPFDGASALDTPTEPRSLAYLSLRYDFDPDEIDGMTLRFSADSGYFDRSGVDPENVVLYRQTDAGAWEALPTEVVGDETARERGLPADRVHFRARTDDFSTFAVAEEVPHLTVTDASLDATTAAPNETVTVRATVQNGGGAGGERSITLTADGAAVATERVALEPNGSTTVDLTGRFETGGEIALAVDGVSAGRLVVENPATDVDSEATEDDPGTPDDSAAVGGADATGTPAADGNPSAADDLSGTAADVEGNAGSAGALLEPSGIDLVELGGLVLFVAIAVAFVALARRMPRS
ncbi:PGF-pre-PGF domain-containing protein [Halobellus rarus]|uniref:PGF-pre-PGF domain-containing protein n=1 Tax=Halobellus rarus TaxID=1126237 RepID=A0ABD6CNI7_9EURY|nr:PGF-pre-PGF domain-containing protein [Halobellus rarus]